MKHWRFLCGLLAMGLICTGCGLTAAPENTKDVPAVTAGEAVVGETDAPGPEQEAESALTLDVGVTYQTLEGFGASGGWWAQDVGGWTEEENGVPLREQVLALLYDPETGIGLDIYRYNLGASTREKEYTGIFWDNWRRAESFLTSEGAVDYTRDANAVWCMEEAVRLGASQVVFFANSAPDQMTANGLAHCDKPGTCNLPEENYQAFADYCIGAAKHFRERGIPVTQLSPVNEPQWDWTEGQEGCYFTAEQLVSLYRVFQQTMNAELPEVELSLPESGEWKNNQIKQYITEIMKDDLLSRTVKFIDGHSYWTDKMDKQLFKAWMDQNYPDLKLRATEWCQMANGREETMRSALELASVIIEDLTVLDVTAWSCWLGVSRYDYHDGLMYVHSFTHEITPVKRLWAYGNFSRFIQPGAVRIEAETGIRDVSAVAFTQSGETVAVLVNRGKNHTLSIPANARVYLTDAEHDLVEVENTVVQTLPAESVITVIIPAE